MRDVPVAALPRRARHVAVTLHVIASVGWLGAIAASLVLTVQRHLAAVVTLQTELIPILAVATLATGAVLSLGTRWGLLRHWWIVAKLAIAVAVITGGILLTGPHAHEATTDPATAPRVIGSTAGHLLALAAATALSVVKPRGATPWFRRPATRSDGRAERGRRAIRRPDTASTHTRQETPT